MPRSPQSWRRAMRVIGVPPTTSTTRVAWLPTTVGEEARRVMDVGYEGCFWMVLVL